MYLFPLYLPSISHLKIEQKTAFLMYFKCWFQMRFKYGLNDIKHLLEETDKIILYKYILNAFKFCKGLVTVGRTI